MQYWMGVSVWFVNRHPDENRGLGRLCRGSIPFFSKEGVAGSTRRGSLVLVRGHCCGLVSGGNVEIPAFAGMTTVFPFSVTPA